MGPGTNKLYHALMDQLRAKFLVHEPVSWVLETALNHFSQLHPKVKRFRGLCNVWHPDSR